MEFTFETSYKQKALTTMARALRKTVRKKRSRRSHILGWIVMIMGAFLAVNSLRSGVVFDAKNIVTWLAILAIFIVFIWEDALNNTRHFYCIYLGRRIKWLHSKQTYA